MEFLDLPEKVSEYDLRKAIIHNLKNFILEIGKDFTFVGEEYRVQPVSEEDVSKYGIVAGKPVDDRVFKVRDMVEKPDKEHAPSNIAILGLYNNTANI